MRMKRTLVIAMAVMIPLLSGCNANEPDAGEVGVWVEKPMFFGHGGVDPTVVKTGRSYGAITSNVVYVNSRPYRINEPFQDLTTSDKTPVIFTVYLTVQNDAGKAADLVQDWGVDDTNRGKGTSWYTQNIQEPFRTFVRNFARNQNYQDLMTSDELIGRMENTLFDKTKALIDKKGIPVKLISVTVGKVNPPREVILEAAETAKQQQVAKTQKQRELAEIARKQAEIAKAEADKAYAKTFGMTPREYLQLRSIEIQKEMLPILKQNQSAHINIIMGMSDSSGLMPTLPIGSRK